MNVSCLDVNILEMMIFFPLILLTYPERSITRQFLDLGMGALAQVFITLSTLIKVMLGFLRRATYQIWTDSSSTTSVMLMAMMVMLMMFMMLMIVFVLMIVIMFVIAAFFLLFLFMLMMLMSVIAMPSVLMFFFVYGVSEGDCFMFVMGV